MSDKIITLGEQQAPKGDEYHFEIFSTPEGPRVKLDVPINVGIVAQYKAGDGTPAAMVICVMDARQRVPTLGMLEKVKFLALEWWQTIDRLQKQTSNKIIPVTADLIGKLH